MLTITPLSPRAIEGAVIPGVHYEVYERHEAAHAREWVLRHTDEPRAG